MEALQRLCPLFGQVIFNFFPQLTSVFYSRRLFGLLWMLAMNFKFQYQSEFQVVLLHYIYMLTFRNKEGFNCLIGRIKHLTMLYCVGLL